jgi:hypothetical protein
MLFVGQDHALGGEAVPQGIAAGDRARARWAARAEPSVATIGLICWKLVMAGPRMPRCWSLARVRSRRHDRARSRRAFGDIELMPATDRPFAGLRIPWLWHQRRCAPALASMPFSVHHPSSLPRVWSARGWVNLLSPHGAELFFAVRSDAF